ncbi:24905_t:CDS:1, partial [Racocetra persica]
MTKNPYDSFASPKENVHAKWYVDGKEYFYAVSEALMAAEKEIFIEDWWLSPEL